MSKLSDLDRAARETLAEVRRIWRAHRDMPTMDAQAEATAALVRFAEEQRAIGARDGLFIAQEYVTIERLGGAIATEWSAAEDALELHISAGFPARLAPAPARDAAGRGGCYDCGATENASACPNCGKVVCRRCAETPYEWCCDAQAGDGGEHG